MAAKREVNHEMWKKALAHSIMLTYTHPHPPYLLFYGKCAGIRNMGGSLYSHSGVATADMQSMHKPQTVAYAVCTCTLTHCYAIRQGSHCAE